MNGGNAPRRYDSAAIVLHWALAGALLLELPLGFRAAHAAHDAQAAGLLRLHVPLGMLILLLAGSAVIRRYLHAPPPPPAVRPIWQVGVARAAHAALYIMPIVLAVSGLALLILSHAAPAVFSRTAGTLPNFSSYPPMAVHAFGAFALVGLFCLHAAAVLYHQLYRRDRLLSRMGIGSQAGAA